mgnify:FL=1
MKKLLLVLLALVLVGLLFLPSRGGHTAGKLLTEEEAAAIAEPYFRENYGLEVEVTDVRLGYIGDKRWESAITVSDGTEEYELQLDQKQEPLCDSVEALRALRTLKDRYPDGLRAAFGLTRYDSESCGTVQYANDHKYCPYFTFETHKLPQDEDADTLWELLRVLDEIDAYNVEVDVLTPDFLPQRDGSETLMSYTFFPNVDRAQFDASYSDFQDCVFWDEGKFQETAEQLEDAGYQDVSFEITGYDLNGSRILIGCRAGLPEGGTAEEAEAIVGEMDGNWFRVRGKAVGFRFTAD